METAPRSLRLLGSGIAATAGFVDACGFIAVSGYFVSFMSGNSTRLAVSLGNEWARAAMPFGIISCFVLGVAAGDLFGGLSSSRTRRVLGLVAVMLGIAASVSLVSDNAGALCAAAGMGASNAVFANARTLPVGLTYMTGTLVHIGRQLALKMRRQQTSALPYLIHWLALLAGGILGTIAELHYALRALWFAVAFVCVLAWLAPDQPNAPDRAETSP